MSVQSIPRKPRIALIGVTGYAGIYLQMLRPFMVRDEVELGAVAIINRAQPAAAAAAAELAGWGAKIYDTTEAFFAGEAGKVELCLIPTGIAWHARLTVAALHAGMHVLVEKPLAGSRSDVALIRRAEHETGRWVAVGFQDIYSEAARMLRSELSTGVIGRVQSVAAFGLWPRPLSYYQRNHWAGRLRADDADVLDSPMNNAFAHFVNLGLLFAESEAHPDAETRFLDAELWRVNAIESFDTAVVRGRFGNGVKFWFGFSHATKEVHEPEIIVTGTGGEARWVHEKQVDIVTQDGERRVLPMADAFACRHQMLRAVLARTRERHAPVCDTALAAKHTAFICDLHAFAEIEEFPGHLIERQCSSTGAPVHLRVGGLGTAMRRAFANRSTLAATGVIPGVGLPSVLSGS